MWCVKVWPSAIAESNEMLVKNVDLWASFQDSLNHTLENNLGKIWSLQTPQVFPILAKV